MSASRSARPRHGDLFFTIADTALIQLIRRAALGTLSRSRQNAACRPQAPLGGRAVQGGRAWRSPILYGCAGGRHRAQERGRHLRLPNTLKVVKITVRSSRLARALAGIFNTIKPGRTSSFAGPTSRPIISI